MSKKRKSLVTGGVGFVGYHLVDALVARGDEVIVVDMAAKAHRPDVTYIKSDICDGDAMEKACKGVDVIFHNASVVHTKQNLVGKVWKVNLGGTTNMLRAARDAGVSRFVYVSSASAVYEGADLENGDESLPYSRISQAPYADSKIAAEQEVLACNGKNGLLTCAIRPHVIFGPGDNRLVPNILARAKEGKLRFQIGLEEKLSDFTYVTNLVDALLAADEALVPGSKVAGQAYFITNGEPMSFWAFVNGFITQLGYKPITTRLPYPMIYGIAALAEAVDTLRGGSLGNEDGLTRFAIKYLCTHHYFSIEKARRDFGYNPRVSIAEGITKTIAHLRATGQA